MIATTLTTILGMCGCFIAPPRQQEHRLVNESSKVVIVRDGDRTVITMSNDFKGDAKELAILVPVPSFIEREQINVGDAESFAPLESWTAPRLVEPLDDPCNVNIAMEGRGAPSASDKAGASRVGGSGGGRENPVTVEARYTVGEYDIVLLSARESDGLQKWLTTNGYKPPPGSSEVFESYIKQKMRFFVAKVNLKEKSKLGFSYLRPLQLAYETPKFMLPIRLGMANADGPQELTVYAITKNGRVEPTNYRTVKIPTGMQVPIYVKDEPAAFYRALFLEQSRKEDMRVVFLEFAGAPAFGNFGNQGNPNGGMRRGGWNGGATTLGAVAPPTAAQLRKLGVFWAKDNAAPQAWVTRLHFRYDEETFPEDLVFQETADGSAFQASYSLLPMWSKTATCMDESQRRQSYGPGEDQAAQMLARLTGWDVNDVRARMRDGKTSTTTTTPGDPIPAATPPPPTPAPTKWFDKLWND